ncbi:MAG: dockerin type I repeat-containing protein, partial [Pseudomonadota bacterium]
MKKLATSIAALGLLAGGSVASACTLSAWSAPSGTAPVVGGPADPVTVSRFGGICAMQADSGTQWVQDNSPAAEGTLIVRFYVLVNGSGDATVFEAYSDEGGSTPVFSVSTTGSNVTVTPASGTAASTSAGAGWTPIEVSWTSGGAISLWVAGNAGAGDAADATGTDTGSATVEAIQFGAVNGLGGFTSINFDDYESRRTTAIGQLCQGDANNDGTINVVDASAVVAERLNPTTNPAPGAPDANGDGTINVVDASAIVAIRL